MSNNLIYATWGLAEEFLQYGYVVEAVNCLEGLCKKVSFDIKPLDEVETRLRLSQILLKYTTNVNRAKSHLERAHLKLAEIGNQTSIDARSKTKHNVIQCRIYKALSETYKLLGDYEQTHKSILKGYDAAKGDTEWRNVFLLDLITTMIYSVDSDQSENINKYFAEAHKENKSDHYMASVFLLAETQYRIQNLSLKRATECLEKSTTHIEILKQDQKSNDKVEQANLVYLQLHHSVLNSLCAVRLNNFKLAKSAMLTLQSDLKAFGDLKVDSSKCRYSWLPMSSTFIVSLFLAGLYQSWIGAYEKSTQNYDKALEKIQRQMQSIERTAKGYTADTEFAVQIKFCLTMKMYFYLQKSMNAASQSNMKQAVDNLKSAQVCASTEEDLFWNFNFNIHVAAGILSAILNQTELSLKHFAHVIEDCKNSELVAYAIIFKCGTKLSMLTVDNQSQVLKEIFQDLDTVKQQKEVMKVEGICAAESLVRGILCSMSDTATADAEKYISQSLSHFSVNNEQFAHKAANILERLRSGSLREYFLAQSAGTEGAVIDIGGEERAFYSVLEWASITDEN